MLTLVVGCGDFGRNIALELDHAGHEVILIDRNYQNFGLLPESFRGKRVNGEAMSPEVLQRARVDDLEAVVLTSRNDVNNLVLARMFKKLYGKKKIISLNTSPAYRFYYELMDAETVSILNWGSLKIEEMLSELPENSIYSTGTNAVGSYNVKVPDGTREYISLELVRIPSCIIFALTHDDVTSAFTDESVVVPGDTLHISASSEGLKNLYTFFGLETAKEEE